MKKLRKYIKIEVGDKISKLTVKKILEKDNRSGIYLLCICECDNEVTIRSDTFRNGKFNNCLKCGIWSSFDQMSYIYSSYKDCAKDRNIIFNLNKEEVENIVFKNCYYCDSIPRERLIKRGKKYKSIKYNGIDRIDSSKGYIADNILPCCYTCNIAKSDLTYEEFIDHIENIYLNLKGK